MGDPHGIGPEVLLKTLQCLLQRDSIAPVVFGAEDYLRRLYTSLRLDFDWNKVEFVSVVECPYPPQWGQVGEMSGRVALGALRSAILYSRDEMCPLLVTASSSVW